MSTDTTPPDEQATAEPVETVDINDAREQVRLEVRPFG